MSNISGFIIENGVLTEYTGCGEDVVIPENVTYIGTNAFQNCSRLNRVVFNGKPPSAANAFPESFI